MILFAVPGEPNDKCLTELSCAVYLHKMWSSEPNMFTNAVAQNARRQRKYVWSIAQLQLLKLPSPSILTKGLYMNLISWWGLLSIISR